MSEEKPQRSFPQTPGFFPEHWEAPLGPRPAQSPVPGPVGAELLPLPSLLFSPDALPPALLLPIARPLTSVCMQLHYNLLMHAHAWPLHEQNIP